MEPLSVFERLFASKNIWDMHDFDLSGSREVIGHVTI